MNTSSIETLFSAPENSGSTYTTPTAQEVPNGGVQNLFQVPESEIPYEPPSVKPLMSRGIGGEGDPLGAALLKTSFSRGLLAGTDKFLSTVQSWVNKINPEIFGTDFENKKEDRLSSYKKEGQDSFGFTSGDIASQIAITAPLNAVPGYSIGKLGQALSNSGLAAKAAGYAGQGALWGGTSSALFGGDTENIVDSSLAGGVLGGILGPATQYGSAVKKFGEQKTHAESMGISTIWNQDTKPHRLKQLVQYVTESIPGLSQKKARTLQIEEEFKPAVESIINGLSLKVFNPSKMGAGDLDYAEEVRKGFINFKQSMETKNKELWAPFYQEARTAGVKPDLTEAYITAKNILNTYGDELKSYKNNLNDFINKLNKGGLVDLQQINAYKGKFWEDGSSLAASKKYQVLHGSIFEEFKSLYNKIDKGIAEGLEKTGNQTLIDSFAANKTFTKGMYQALNLKNSNLLQKAVSEKINAFQFTHKLLTEDPQTLAAHLNTIDTKGRFALRAQAVKSAYESSLVDDTLNLTKFIEKTSTPQIKAIMGDSFSSLEGLQTYMRYNTEFMKSIGNANQTAKFAIGGAAAGSVLSSAAGFGGGVGVPAVAAAGVSLAAANKIIKHSPLKRSLLWLQKSTNLDNDVSQHLINTIPEYMMKAGIFLNNENNSIEAVD